MPQREHAGWKRNAGFYIAGQFLSMFGSMLVSHAVTFHITLDKQSGALIALFTCAAMLPMVFISPFAGVWADRYNRKYLVNIADAAIALVTLGVALAYRAGHQSVWLLFATVVARSVGMGIQQPAGSALIPQIVPPEHLTRFNGIQSTAQSLTMFAAPMAAGALLYYMPIETVFFIDVATAAVGIATVFFCVRVPPLERAGGQAPGAGTYYREMAEGFRFVGERRWLRTMLVSCAAFGILASPAAMLTPLQVARTFGNDEWRLAAIEIAFSAGMMAGGILISAWGGFKNKAGTMVLAWFAFGVTTLLFGVIPNFWLYTAVMVLCGCSMPVYNTPAMTLMQQNIPPQYMGRVFSVLMIINGLAMPLGMALFGPLGDAVRIELLLMITGLLLIAGAGVLRGRKELRAVGSS